MPKIVVNAAPEQVFTAISDLTRHADWAVHQITIEAVGEGSPQVGSTYKCTHKGRPGDMVTVTELVPNQRFGFRSVMPNKMEFAFTMTVSPQGDGSLVTRSGQPAKLPGATKLFLPARRLSLPAVGIWCSGARGRCGPYRLTQIAWKSRATHSRSNKRFGRTHLGLRITRWLRTACSCMHR